MTIKASATVTITRYRDTKSVTRYYKLQSSTASAPSKPTTNPPSGWTDAEPSYTSGSTNTLYFCDLSVFSDDTYAYSSVSKSTSYEAAKEAYNKAKNAQDGLNNLKIGGRNLLVNSRFNDNADKWGSTTSVSEFIEKYGRDCAHISQTALKVTKYVQQSILDKVEPNTQYTMSGWVMTENITKGSTNFCIMFYCDGSYTKDGTSTWFGYGSKAFTVNTGTGAWQYLTWTFTTDTTKLPNATSLNMYVYTRDFTGDVYFCDLKLEKGNRVTDWTPAPEDLATSDALDAVDKAAQDNSDRLDERMRTAEMTIDKIEGLISTLVVDSNGGSLMEQTSDGWVFSMGKTLEQLQSTVDGLKNLGNELDANNGDISALQNIVNGIEALTAYIRIVTIDDQPCIELGNESSFKLRITNTSIQFIDGTTIPAYVTNQSLKIGKAEVEDELAFGGFAFAERSNGNMGLIWKGSDE